MDKEITKNYKTPEQLKELQENWTEKQYEQNKKILEELKGGFQAVLVNEYKWDDEEVKTLIDIYDVYTLKALAIVFVELGGEITSYDKVITYITVITPSPYGLNFKNVDTNYASQTYKIKK